MPRVRWVSVPFATAQTPVEQHWYCIDDATIASTADLADVVLAQAQLPSTTKLYLQTESGWREISSLAEVPGGDLVGKAVEGRVRWAHFVLCGQPGWMWGSVTVLAILQQAKNFTRSQESKWVAAVAVQLAVGALTCCLYSTLYFSLCWCFLSSYTHRGNKLFVLDCRRTQDNTPGQKPDRKDHSGLHHWRQARCRRDSDSARAWQLNVISAASLVCHIPHKVGSLCYLPDKLTQTRNRHHLASAGMPSSLTRYVWTKMVLLC